MKSNQLVLELEQLKVNYAEQGLEIQLAELERERLRLKYVSWLIGVGLLFFFVSWHYTRYRLKSKEIEANQLRQIENAREVLLRNKEEQLRHKTALILGFKNRLRKIDEVLERGQAWVTAERLDEGSWDNCGEISAIEVRRMTDAGMSAWAEAISFDCSDEGVEVLVELRVADAVGNETICWTNITPVDKTQPECRDKGTVLYNCDELPSGDDLSGTSAVWGQFFDDSLTLAKVSTDELCSSNMEVFDTEVNIDQCGYGYVNRYYRVFRTIDDKEFADSCRMSLVFSEHHNYSITFPADVAEACTDLNESGIAYVEGGCDLITVSIVNETYDATAEECYKIFRTFNVINWCEYEEGAAVKVVERRDWDEDGYVGDATTVNVSYQEGIQHIYTDYQNGYTSTAPYNYEADRRDTLSSVGTTTHNDSIVKWESALPGAYDEATSKAVEDYKHYTGTGEGAVDVEGFQEALSYEGLELVDIVEDVATADHFGSKFAAEGVLLTSWNGTAAEAEHT